MAGDWRVHDWLSSCSSALAGMAGSCTQLGLHIFTLARFLTWQHRVPENEVETAWSFMTSLGSHIAGCQSQSMD